MVVESPDWFGLAETLKSITFHSLAMARDTFHWMRLLQALSNVFFTVVKITRRTRNTHVEQVVLVAAAVSSSPTHRFVARAPDLDKTEFSGCALYFEQRSV